MKSKEEIEQLANEYSTIGKEAGLTFKEHTLENIAFINGYTQCQADMFNDFLSLIEEFKQKELPNRNNRYHYEAEIASGLKHFELFIKGKQLKYKK